MKLRRLFFAVLMIVAMAAAPAFAWGTPKLSVYNPSGSIEIQHELAPRLADLNGKRVALWLSGNEYGTGKSAAVYDALAQELKAKYPKIEIIPYTQLPITYSPAPEVIKTILAAKPDAVVVGVGG